MSKWRKDSWRKLQKDHAYDSEHRTAAWRDAGIYHESTAMYQPQDTKDVGTTVIAALKAAMEAESKPFIKTKRRSLRPRIMWN